MPKNTSVFQLPERMKENIVEENLATREELEDTIARATSGDLKAQVKLYDVCDAYKENLFRKMWKIRREVYTEMYNNKKPEIVKNIADNKLNIYNDEIKRECFNEDYSGKYQNVINDLREKVEFDAEEELQILLLPKADKHPLVQNVWNEIKDLSQSFHKIESVLSHEQLLTTKNMEINVRERKNFVWDMLQLQKQLQKGEEYFPSFDDKYEYGFNHQMYRTDFLRYNDTGEKFNLLANLELPQYNVLPTPYDHMKIVSISDIKGDFDKDGKLHLNNMTVKQKNTSPLVSYTQKISFDFQTGTLHVAGLKQKEESASRYAYDIPIEKVDGRILRLQKELAYCDEKLYSNPFAKDWFSLKEKKEALTKRINAYMRIDGNATDKKKERDREDDHECR